MNPICQWTVVNTFIIVITMDVSFTEHFFLQKQICQNAPFTHTHTHTHIHKHTHARTHARMHTHTHTLLIIITWLHLPEYT